MAAHGLALVQVAHDAEVRILEQMQIQATTPEPRGSVPC